MTRSEKTAFWSIIFSLIFALNAFGHGGQYRGPGNTVPPSMSGPGGSVPSAGATACSVGPVGPAGPSVTPSRGGNYVKRIVRGSAGGLQRKATGMGQGFDRWEFWWEYNKDVYLDLKNKLFGNDKVSGSSSFLIGRRPKSQFKTSRVATSEIMKSDVLPILIKALQIDHPDIQDSSVLALARITDQADAGLVLDSIKELLASKHHTAQQSACLSLGVLGSPEAIAICRDLIFDSAEGKKLTGQARVPRLVSAFAALSLGIIGAEEGIPTLMEVIEKVNPMTQKDLLACAITALGLMGHTQQVEEIATFLTTRLEDSKMDPFLRASLPVALGRLGDRSVLTTILNLFKQEELNPWVRQSCVIALGQLGNLEQDAVIDSLTRYIQNGKDQQSRHLAFIALAQIGSRHPSYNDLPGPHHKLNRFLLMEIVRPERNSHRSWAALAAAIHAMAHPPLQGPTIDRLEHGFQDTRNPSHKGAMAIGLGLLNAERAAPLLYRNLCESKDKTLQGYLCVGIGLMRWTGAAEKIRTLASGEPSFFLRLQASVSLGLMGDTQALKVLIQALQNGETLFVISSAARALGQIGDVNALAPLKKIVEDERYSELSKAFAMVAMGLIGEKTHLPWNARISEHCNYGASTTALVEVMDIL